MVDSAEHNRPPNNRQTDDGAVTQSASVGHVGSNPTLDTKNPITHCADCGRRCTVMLVMKPGADGKYWALCRTHYFNPIEHPTPKIPRTSP